MDKCPDVEETALNGFQELIDQTEKDGEVQNLFYFLTNKSVFQGMPDDDLQMLINHPALDEPIPIPRTSRQQLTAHKIVNVIKRVQQSKRELNFDQHMDVKLTRIHKHKGGRNGDP